MKRLAHDSIHMIRSLLLVLVGSILFFSPAAEAHVSGQLLIEWENDPTIQNPQVLDQDALPNNTRLQVKFIAKVVVPSMSYCLKDIVVNFSIERIPGYATADLSPASISRPLKGPQDLPITGTSSIVMTGFETNLNITVSKSFETSTEGRYMVGANATPSSQAVQDCSLEEAHYVAYGFLVKNAVANLTGEESAPSMGDEVAAEEAPGFEVALLLPALVGVLFRRRKS